MEDKIKKQDSTEGNADFIDHKSASGNNDVPSEEITKNITEGYTLRIIFNSLLMTFFIIVAVVGTVCLILLSDHSLNYHSEQEQMEQLSKNNDSYAQSVMDKMDADSGSNPFSYSQLKKKDAALKEKHNSKKIENLVHQDSVSGDSDQKASLIKSDGRKIASEVHGISVHKSLIPWKADMELLSYLLFAAMTMLLASSLFFRSDNGKRAALFMIIFAIAASVAAIVYSVGIVVRYKQVSLGGIWLVASGASLISCSLACLVGISVVRNYHVSGMLASLSRNTRMLLCIIGIAGFLVAGILRMSSVAFADKNIDIRYCSEHQMHSGCK